MLSIKDGIIVDPKVKIRIYPSLEHGELRTVSGLIVHQTSKNFAGTTTIQYLFGQTTGAHFLIDTNGLITQTARVTQICHHVGLIRSRCQVIHACSPAEKKLYQDIEDNNDKENARKLIHRNEISKQAPHRYPKNEDSIGIEVVGAPRTSRSGQKYYGDGTWEQDVAATWLVKELVSTIILRGDDIYSGGVEEKLFLNKRNKPSYDQVFSHNAVSPHKTDGEGDLIGRW